MVFYSAAMHLLAQRGGTEAPRAKAVWDLFVDVSTIVYLR